MLSISFVEINNFLFLIFDNLRVEFLVLAVSYNKIHAVAYCMFTETHARLTNKNLVRFSDRNSVANLTVNTSKQVSQFDIGKCE